VTNTGRRNANLSERENQVLHWMSQRKTQAEIAVILGISPATVRKHAGKIYRKLKVPNRICAVFHAT
jgi:DNA-binding CsgD family transcriptional regulator